MSTLMLRMAFSVPIYLFILMSLKKPPTKIRGKDHFYLFLLGFVGYYLASYLDFRGLTYIKASLERLILFIYPTLVILLSALLLKKHISNIQKIGVLITYLGILVVFLPELLQSTETDSQAVLTGGMLVFFSALTYSTYLVGSQWLIPKFGIRRFTAIAMIWSGLMVSIHFWMVIDSPSSLLRWNTEVYVLGLMMSIFSTVLPSFLISGAIHQLGAAQFSIFGSLGPVSTISLAYLFLEERLTGVQVIGSMIVIAGVMTAEYYGKKRAKASP